MDNSKSPSPPPPPPPPVATATATATANRALENFKALLMKCATASTPTQSLSVPHAAFIQQRIQQLLPHFPTPHHPPYASMIENAIKQLNVERGSSEEAISKFISEEYKGLPLAHSTLLKHHLRKLCEYGDLVESLDGCYLFGKATTSLKPSSNPTPPLNSVASPSSSPVCSSDLEYASSSTSSSTKSFSLKRKRRTRNDKRKKNKIRKQKARGIKINRKSKDTPDGGWSQGQGQGQGQGEGQGRIQARGQVRGRGRERSLGQPCKENVMDREDNAFVGQEENKESMDHTTKTQNIVVENEVTSEYIQRQNQDPVNVTMVIEIESSRQEERIEDTSSRPSTSKQGQRSKKGWPKESIRRKNKPQPGRKPGRPRKKDLQMEETGKNTEHLEAATDMGKDKLETDEQSQTRKSPSSQSSVGVILIDDDHVVPERLTSDFPPAVEGNMMDGEIEDMMDELIEEVYMEIKQETLYLNIIDEAVEQISQEEQNQVQGNTLVELQIQLNENKNEDEGVKGHNHTSELQDEINEKSFADQTSEIGKVCLDEQQQIEPSMDLNEPQTHEYHGIKIQEQVEIIGQKNLCNEECSIIEEKSHLKYASEVLDEQDQHIKQPEAITEQNQLEELDCILIDGEKKDNKEFEHFDELKKPDSETIEKQKQPYTEHSDGQSQQLEEQNHQVQRAEVDQQIESSKGMGAEILSPDTFSEVKSVDDDSSAIHFPPQPYMEQNENQSQQSEEQNQEVEMTRNDQQIELSKVKSVEDSSTVHFPPQPHIEQNENQSGQLEEQNQEVEMTENDRQKEFSKVKSVEDSSTIHFPLQPYIEHNENHSQQSKEKNQEVEMTENYQQIELSKVKSVEDSSTINFPPQPHIEQNENQSQQLEEQNQDVEMTINDQQIELSEGMGAEILSQETFSEVKSVEDSSIIQILPPLEKATEKPYCQKLRPRPTKFQLDQEEEQPRIPSVQKSLETNQRHKLRPRPSKRESVEDANRKQQEQSTRRSLRPRPTMSGT